MVQKVLVALVISFVGSLGFSQNENRAWTSSDGKSSFQGRLTSATDTSVKVRHQNGQTFDLPLEKISQVDRDYVATYLKGQLRAKGLEEGLFADKLNGQWVKVPASEQGILFQIYGDARRLKRQADEGFPLFVHLHGASSRGSDVETGKVEIAAKRLVQDHYDDHPCVLIVPTCPENTFWGDHRTALENLIDLACDSLPIDRSRIYLSGYSMGAVGIGALLESRPEHYAAALFADGKPKMAWAGKVDAALWFTYSGERDLKTAESVAAAHSAAGKVAKFNGHPDRTHNQIHWTLAKTDGVYDWLFEQRLATKE